MTAGYEIDQMRSYNDLRLHWLHIHVSASSSGRRRPQNTQTAIGSSDENKSNVPRLSSADGNGISEPPTFQA
jgi:hypothetical protein